MTCVSGWLPTPNPAMLVPTIGTPAGQTLPMPTPGGDEGPPSMGGPAVPGHLQGLSFSPPSVVGSMCLPAGEPILLSDGQVKPVEKMSKGDMVIVPNDTAPEGEKRICRVVEFYENGLQNVVRLTFGTENGERFTVRASVGHRFYVRNNDFTHAIDLEIGAECLSAAGKTIVLLEKELEPELAFVYNFQVEDAHTYCPPQIIEPFDRFFRIEGHEYDETDFGRLPETLSGREYDS